MKRPVHWAEQTVERKTHWNYDIRVFLAATHELRRATYGMQSILELRRSCLTAATHEASSTLRRANHGMRNALELPHSSVAPNLRCMKRPIHCAEQQESPFNIPKCSALARKAKLAKLQHQQIIFAPATRNHRHCLRHDK